MLRGNWSSSRIRLSRRRGPPAGGLSSPPAARSSSAPNCARMVLSRHCRTTEDSSPNQKRTRRFNSAADSGSGPNQKSLTLRASSISLRFRVAVRLKQLLQLLRGLERSGEELLVVLLDLVLLGEGRLIVNAEAPYHLARLRRALPGSLQQCRGHLQARPIGLAHDVLGPDACVHEREHVLAAAGAREDADLGELLAHQYRGARGGLDVI